MSKKHLVNTALLLTATLIAFIPLMIVKGSEFAGADEAAVEMVKEINENFQPWCNPIWEPPGSETESFLFALQAAFGSGVLFYCIGYLNGRGKKKDDEQNDLHR